MTNRDSSAAAAGIRTPLLILLVALAGAATMVIELGAVRLLAPWFGTSSSVWTNVIGVVLAALALGYAIGARLASGSRPLRTLGIALMLGGMLAACLPLAASLIARAFMPEGVALHEAVDLLVWGSLAAATVLFLPAAATLGCAGPLAVEALQRTRAGDESRGSGAGRAGGHVLAASTIGSLAGTFGTTHVLIPGLGVTHSFMVAAVTLVLAGGLLLFLQAAKGSRQRVTTALVVAWSLIGAARFAGVAESRASAERDGETLVARRDSSLQSLRVAETGDGAERMRFLRVNEGLDSFQSVWRPEPGLLGGGHYYDYFALPYAWAMREQGAPPETWDVLIIGLGAGTAVRVLEGVVDEATELRTVGIEIDPEVVALGAEFFDLENNGDDRVAIGGLDGRAALRYADAEFDQIIVDAYANNMEIPPHLASVEAFAEMQARLKDGGWLSINVGGFGFDDPVVEAVAAAASAGMGEPISLGRVAFSRNLCAILRREGDVPRPGTSEFGSRGRPLVGDLDRLVNLLVAPEAWSQLEQDDLRSAARTDDTSSMEELQLQSIRIAEGRLRALDTAAGDGAEVGAFGDEVASADDEGKSLAASRLASEAGSDLALAFQAADEIAAPGLRARTRANLLWGAGDPFGALEAINEALRHRPNDLSGLLTAANLGLIVGATESSEVRLKRAQGILQAAEPVGEESPMSAETRGWWEDQFGGLAASQAEALQVATARRSAVDRARLTVALAAAAALGLIVILTFTRTPSAAPAGAAVTG